MTKTAKTTAPAAGGNAGKPEKIEYRMKDLIRESGLSRKTIHYYFNEGLLPPPQKSGRNTAIYGPEHLERLRQICILREQQFVPVKIIKALFDASASVGLTAEQQQYLRELRLGLPDSIRPGAERYVRLKEVFGAAVSARELKAFEEEGLIKIIGSGANRVISNEDAVVVDSWIRFRELGFTADKGYGPQMLKLWDHAIEQLVVGEITHLADGLSRDSEADSQQVTQEAMLIVSKLIEALHHKKTRIQFSKLDAQTRSR